MLKNDQKIYRLSRDKIIQLLSTSRKNGLTEKESVQRRKKHGENRLPQKKSLNLVNLFLNQFKDFMILVLISATVISLIMGEFSDGVTIFAIIVLNAILGFVQEYRAEKSLKALKELTSPSARVIREGKLKTVPARKLVPGDIIELKCGDRVPADARILTGENLQVKESILTGESNPVNKDAKQLKTDNLPLQKQKNILFMGTNITRGQARGVVVRTGEKTEMGRIAGLLETQEKDLTPLQKRLKYLGKWLVIASILLTVLVVITGIVKGRSIYQMFMAGVSLAVAAIPEGLPAIVTLALAIGVQKMIKKKAIVRRLPAVETLGCATVICSDKTGTLTQNEMKVDKLFYNQHLFSFNNLKKDQELKKILQVGALCNEVVPEGYQLKSRTEMVTDYISGKKDFDFAGDPTDLALMKILKNTKYRPENFLEQYNLLAQNSFVSERKRMSVMVENEEKKCQELWLKGAPEKILELSSYIQIKGQKRKLTPTLKKEILRANENMARKALRVLALAYRKLPDKVSKNNSRKYEKELIVVGLVGLIDPPRPEVKKAVKDCQRAGIKPVMITGDQAMTARVIAEKLDIITSAKEVITGDKISEINDRKLSRLLEEKKVFARINPSQKLRIVKLFKQKGEVVAMTGDGVNDAPAVKEADIGIAMGQNGTDVTREVSAMVLADDNFATIVAAINQGRHIYNNIRKFIRYLLSCNIGELLTIFLGIFMGLPLPLIPIQILWVNLVTDGLPALALGLDNDSSDVMSRPPRDPEENIFSQGLSGKIASQGILIGINTLLVYLLALFRLQGGLSLARTMAFCTLVFSQLFFVFSCRSENKSLFKIPLFANFYLLGAVFISLIMQFLVIYHPLLKNIFETSILNLQQWSIVILFSVCSTLILEALNSLIRNYDHNF